MHLLSDLGDVFAKKMQFTKKDFMNAVSDSIFLDSLGYKPSTIIGVFIPNTYDFYWDISAATSCARWSRTAISSGLRSACRKPRPTV